MSNWVVKVVVSVVKESMVYGGRLMNHSRANPLRATENDLHNTASSVEYSPTCWYR